MLYFDGIRSVTQARTLKSGKIKVYEERFALFLGVAALLLFVEGLIGEQGSPGRRLLVWWAIALLLSSTPVRAGEHPDDLYREGRFAEAEKAYARADMDRPRDVRFRYNRGCAAYRNGDYQAAGAAFSSVLRRTKDPRLCFRATYNLGNTAFKQGDFAAAADYYRQAIVTNPEDHDAKVNLELALRALGKQKAQQNQRPGGSKNQNQERDKANADAQQKGASLKQDQQGEKARNNSDRSARTSPQQKEGKHPGENEKAPAPEKQGSAQKDQTSVSKGNKQQNHQGQPKPQEGPLGQLGAAGGQGFEPERNADQNAPAVSIDRKKAEALLDNVKEDRSRFLRFQASNGKRSAVTSGKDW